MIFVPMVPNCIVVVIVVVVFLECSLMLEATVEPMDFLVLLLG
jgi:hypothetical protein